MPGNKLVTVGVALQGLDTWCNSGSAASVLLHLLCDRVYLPHAEFLFGPHTLSVCFTHPALPVLPGWLLLLLLLLLQLLLLFLGICLFSFHEPSQT